jgi:hypothetical protein
VRVERIGDHCTKTRKLVGRSVEAGDDGHRIGDFLIDEEVDVQAEAGDDGDRIETGIQASREKIGREIPAISLVTIEFRFVKQLANRSNSAVSHSGRKWPREPENDDQGTSMKADRR